MKDPQTTEFQNFVQLLGIYTDCSNRIADLENDANDHLLEILTTGIDEYSALQVKLTQTEQALELIARAHDDWFADKKSVTTPYGTVKLHKSTSLDIPNPEATILLIEREGERNPEFKPADYIHTERTPDKEALEKLPVTVLKNLRVFVKEDDSFSVVPAKVKMGKAVREAAKQLKEKAAA